MEAMAIIWPLTDITAAPPGCLLPSPKLKSFKLEKWFLSIGNQQLYSIIQSSCYKTSEVLLWVNLRVCSWTEAKKYSMMLSGNGNHETTDWKEIPVPSQQWSPCGGARKVSVWRVESQWDQLLIFVDSMQIRWALTNAISMHACVCRL